ncbi:PREDICTED: CREB-regulated transcription coactivator 1-like isoform X2 [Nicrophorus vespilloides]|uniref:CREB-regulated transcription coactivator 1-like isoform X2 n=1 Tax=Nicrophorus vespilloides TaxID=110193 RepID=A0ABM1MWJ4_NICVS|nr:PREDICTED: CREB-regulated transcription coactivator 1-like isoform X2 [Nicrophorus vespilloides]
MANPRKFSEKIALHTHRQAEETARFEQIMKEVSDATARVNNEKEPVKSTLRISSQALGSFRGGSLPNVSAQNAEGTPTHTADKTDKKPDEVSHSHTNVHFRESRARSQGGPIRRPQDRKHDTSPYSSGPFLSPPPDTSWRRTNSDSALHQSAMQGMNTERNDSTNSRWMVPAVNGPEHHDNRRPRSSCEVPRVPGINIYHTAHEPGTIQIPIGNNTGSLPDLTSVHFPSPIHAPLDQEHDQGSSPYSSSPVNTSPSTLSPTSILPGARQQTGRFPFNTPVSTHQVVVDNNSTIDNQDFTLMRGMNVYQQPVPPTSPSPTLQQIAGYRSPRPNPQLSPSLGGRHSAPGSPGAPSPLSDYQIYNQHETAQLQQHFNRISMGVDWAQLVASLMESGCTWSAQVQMDTPVSSVSYMEPGNVQLTQSQSQILPEVSTELAGDAGYYSTSPSQLVYQTNPPSLHTTPNTPTSIPDIVLTDFSSADELSRQDMALTKQIEAELLANENELREGLEPLDFDSMQMLSDTGINLIPDSVEDHFRLDRS